MITYKIQVQVFDGEHNEFLWKLARTSTGKVYEFPTREKAEQALMLWDSQGLMPERFRIVEVDS